MADKTKKHSKKIAYKVGVNHESEESRCHRCWMGVLFDNKTPECHTYCAYDNCKL